MILPVDIMIDSECMSLMLACRSNRCRRGREGESYQHSWFLAPAGSWIDPAASKQFQFQFLVSVDMRDTVFSVLFLLIRCSLSINLLLGAGSNQ